MKYLVIVERTADGFRGYAQRLSGCEIRAVTEEEAEAGIIAPVKKYVADGKVSINGSANGEVEVIVGRTIDDIDAFIREIMGNETETPGEKGT